MTEPHNTPPASGQNPIKRGAAPWMTLAIEVFAVVAVLGYMLFRNPDLLKTIFIFLVTLGVLVFVHEWGHYQFARWAGMKVNRFAIGFPPFIYTKRKNNIDYSIGALPIGGMVDIAGLGSEEEMVNTAKGEVSTPQRDTSRPFGQKQFQDGSLFWRFMVLFAGPLMNFLFAIVVFVGVYSLVGVPDATLKARIDSVMVGDPAEKAGIKAGDEIIGIGNQKTLDPEAVTKAIRGGNAKATTVTVLRDGKNVTLPLTPVVKDINNNGKPVPSIGVAFDLNAIRSFKFQKVEPLTAVKLGFLESAGVSLSILDTIKRALTRQLSSQEAKSIGGPVKIAQTVGQASEYGAAVLFRFAALLSVNLGLMNLLPLPALDGGRIMFLGYELVARRPFNPRWEGLVHAAGMLLLLAFMLFITLRDVASL
jgi:regulator of sigma E protease